MRGINPVGDITTNNGVSAYKGEREYDDKRKCRFDCEAPMQELEPRPRSHPPKVSNPEAARMCHKSGACTMTFGRSLDKAQFART